MFHGNMYNRWFDKSFSIIICANGVIGSNVEHSRLDATVGPPGTVLLTLSLSLSLPRLLVKVGSTCYSMRSMMKMVVFYKCLRMDSQRTLNQKSK